MRVVSIHISYWYKNLLLKSTRKGCGRRQTGKSALKQMRLFGFPNHIPGESRCTQAGQAWDASHGVPRSHTANLPWNKRWQLRTNYAKIAAVRFLVGRIQKCRWTVIKERTNASHRDARDEVMHGGDDERVDVCGMRRGVHPVPAGEHVPCKGR